MDFSLHDIISDVPLMTILDVGAMLIDGHGEQYGGLASDGKGRLIGFEPNEDECKKLNATFGEPHRFYPCFIGDGNPAIFYETNRAMTGSLYKPNTPLLSKFQNLAELTTLVQTHQIETKRLDDIEDLGCVDFIKIDVQGSELNVFKGGTKTLENTLLIQVEVEFVEMYEGQPMFSDVDSFLRGSGFQFHTFAGFGRRCFKPVVLNDNINMGLRQYLWSDAIYVKDWMKLDILSTDQLKKYAVLLHDIVKSPDLCYLVLTQLDVREGTGYAKEYLPRCVMS